MKHINSFLDQIFVGDALEILKTLPDDSIDITVTSPPYNKRISNGGWLVKTEGYSHFEDLMDEGEYQELQISILNELYRVTKPGGSLFYNHKTRWVKGLMIHPFSWIVQSSWNIRQEIIWDRGLAANMRGWRFWQVDERIYWLYKPKNRKNVGEELEARHAKMSSIWRLTPAPRKDHHPAPFPLELPIRAIFSLNGKEGTVVLDPYCGSGTTLVAAKICNCSFIGIDISPTYVDHAKLRLENYQKELEQAKKEMDKHKVKDPFISRKNRGTVTWPFGPRRDNTVLETLASDSESSDSYIRSEDVAELLGISRRRIQNFRKHIRTQRIGKRIFYHRGDVEMLANEMEIAQSFFPSALSGEHTDIQQNFSSNVQTEDEWLTDVDSEQAESIDKQTD